MPNKKSIFFNHYAYLFNYWWKSISPFVNGCNAHCCRFSAYGSILYAETYSKFFEPAVTSLKIISICCTKLLTTLLGLFLYEWTWNRNVLTSLNDEPFINFLIELLIKFISKVAFLGWFFIFFVTFHVFCLAFDNIRHAADWDLYFSASVRYEALSSFSRINCTFSDKINVCFVAIWQSKKEMCVILSHRID